MNYSQFVGSGWWGPGFAMKFFEYICWEPKADPEVKDLEDECPCSFLGLLGNIFFVTSMECFFILFPCWIAKFHGKTQPKPPERPIPIAFTRHPIFFFGSLWFFGWGSPFFYGQESLWLSTSMRTSDLLAGLLHLRWINWQLRMRISPFSW